MRYVPALALAAVPAIGWMVARGAPDRASEPGLCDGGEPYTACDGGTRTQLPPSPSPGPPSPSPIPSPTPTPSPTPSPSPSPPPLDAGFSPVFDGGR